MGKISFPNMDWLGLCGALLSTASLLFSYHVESNRPELVAFVDPLKTVIVKANETSKLKIVIDEEPTTDEAPLKSDVSMAQVSVWNAGKKAIQSEDMIKPLKIKTEKQATILEARVIKSSRHAPILHLDQTGADEITVNWDLLERNDGGEIQIIYAGGTSNEITLSAYERNNGNIPTAGSTKHMGTFFKYRVWYLVNGILYIFAFVILLRNRVSLRHVDLRHLVRNILGLIAFICGLVLLGAACFGFFVDTPQPPLFFQVETQSIG